jgi:hypothetical protein
MADLAACQGLPIPQFSMLLDLLFIEHTLKIDYDSL